MPHPITHRVIKEDIIEVAQDLGLELVDEPIEPGDLYLAGRNTGVKFLTCKSVSPRSWIVATEENAYPYDIWECYKVREI